MSSVDGYELRSVVCLLLFLSFLELLRSDLPTCCSDEARLAIRAIMKVAFKEIMVDVSSC